jgi:hypothetical protein
MTLTFFQNFKHDGVVVTHMHQGASPRCYGSDPQPATEDDFAKLQDGARHAFYPTGPLVEHDGKVYSRWTCRQCWWRYVDRKRLEAQG